MTRREMMRTLAGVTSAAYLSPVLGQAGPSQANLATDASAPPPPPMAIPAPTGLGVAPGPFQPTWESLSSHKVPDWYCDARLGIWAPWDPQCQPEMGDWYARKIYQEGGPICRSHAAKYGHPPKFGFKDVINEWKADQRDSEALVGLYRRAGAKLFVVLANHHDNLDIWDSIFEADFLDCSYGFRPGRNAHQALEEIRQNLEQGRREVYDADLSSYFDTIPHDKRMACVRKRVSDRRVLHLIRMWLSAVVVEPGEGPDDPPQYRRSKQGTPQGGVISPLLANLYLHWFDYKFHRADGPYYWANARLVRYADDFVILAKYVKGRIGRFVEQTLREWMGLKINPEKTRTVRSSEPGVGLNFLGYTFRHDRDQYGHARHYLNLIPSEKSLQRVRARLRELTDARQCFTPTRPMIAEINRMLRGWHGYFSLGYPGGAYREVDRYTVQRLWIHLRRRSQRGYKKPQGVAHFQRLGWAPLQKYSRDSRTMNDP